MSENKKVEKEEIVEKKSPNVFVTVLCIVLIIAMFFVGWFAGGKTAELEDKIIDKATEKEEKKKEENVDKEKEVEIKELDLTKCLNNTQNEYSSPYKNDKSCYDMSVKINDDQQSATLIVDWNKFPEMAAENVSNGVKNYQIKGFDKKIEKIYFGGFGHDCSGETLFYLMEDGSVEYTPLYVQKHDTQSPRILSYVNLKNVTDASGNVIEEYTIAVLGDVNGDAELSTMDYISVYNHLDNSKPLSGIYVYAADMNGDDDITTMDYIMIYNALGGTQ